MLFHARPFHSVAELLLGLDIHILARDDTKSVSLGIVKIPNSPLGSAIFEAQKMSKRLDMFQVLKKPFPKQPAMESRRFPRDPGPR